MALWRAIVTLSFVLLLLFLISSVESKRKGSKGRKDDHKQVTLQELCRKSGQNSRKNILELQAFVDLSKAFACLKVETCSRIPVCFVEDTPDLKQESLNDCTVWSLLLHGLQTKRRIEPVRESYATRRNNAHVKPHTDNTWDEAVSSLCHGANVYRFIPGDTVEEGGTGKNGTTKNSSSTDTGTLKPKTSHRNTTLRTIGRPRKRRQGGALLGSLLRRQMKKMKRQNTNSNSSCGILDGCTRICVGQNEKFTHVSDCTQFKIKCTSKRLFRSRSRTGRGKDKRKNPRRNN